MARLIWGIKMQIRDIVSIGKWDRLASVVECVEEEAFLGKSLYQVADGIYLQVSPFRRKEFVHSSDAPFITGVLFSPDPGAAKRVSELAVESDTEAPFEVPIGILPDGFPNEYGAILAALKNMQPKICQESAAYRVALDGKFVHRTIETEHYTFYFRGAEYNNEERPYSILYKLPEKTL